MGSEYREITVKAPAVLLTSAQAQNGPPIAPLTRVMTYSPNDWEDFIDEWVSHCLKSKYLKVVRFSGANDRGIDVAGFADANQLLGVWDNYQCKHYNVGITPGTAWPEIGKILWHSFNGHYKPPRAYYFVAPRGTGTSLSQLLANTPLLKAGLIAAWAKGVETEITSTQAVKLEGEFAGYVEKFDFTIFRSVAPREVIEQHRSSPYFVLRFGGGLPPRPTPAGPPDEIHSDESGYVTQLLAAYADHTKVPVPDISALKKWKQLDEHFLRQRECFYHAEALRVFVRDKVEPGTFEGLQDEIYHGVIDACDGSHADGLERVKAVTAAAQTMSLDAHPLGPSAFIKDRRGICHQLANEDRLKWTT
jgi:hypothetical protein